ncbi:hypothetical protein RA27_19980 [Ruegeria sp. ANG-R]|nr:hypothetical protein RA27_19980 [Ruegeria sp. ANG-R]
MTTIYRTERLIQRRHLAVIQQQTIMIALAGIAVLSALVLLNISLYFVLNAWMSPALSAAALAAANLTLACLLVLVAKRTNVEQEIAPAVEVRDMAIADIEDELSEMATEAREIVGAIKGIGSNPLGSLPTLLIPLLTALLKDRKDK